MRALPFPAVAGIRDDLARGREAYSGSAWKDVHRSLSRAEQAYMLRPVAIQHEAAGDYEGAAATAAMAVEAGERFGDRDLFALAAHVQGALLVTDGHVREGLGLLDEAMVAVTAGEVSPIV